MIVDQIEFRDVPAYVQRRRPFDAGELRAAREGLLLISTFGLATAWHERWLADVARVSYVVCSSGMPIAWILRDGTIVKVDQRLTRVQTGHQALVITGL